MKNSKSILRGMQIYLISSKTFFMKDCWVFSGRWGCGMSQEWTPCVLIVFKLTPFLYISPVTTTRRKFLLGRGKIFFQTCTLCPFDIARGSMKKQFSYRWFYLVFIFSWSSTEIRFNEQSRIWRIASKNIELITTFTLMALWHHTRVGPHLALSPLWHHADVRVRPGDQKLPPKMAWSNWSLPKAWHPA